MRAYPAKAKKQNPAPLGHPDLAGRIVPANYDAWVAMVDEFYEELINADIAQ